MTESPEDDFVRLASLPVNHPDRIAAERSAAFVAWQRMHATFVEGDTPGLDDIARASDEALLAERLARVLPELAAAGAARPVRPRRFGLGAWFAAAAALSIVASALLFARGPRPAPVRGRASVDAAATVQLEPGPPARLTWLPVAGAASYRVTFIGDDLREIVSVDSGEDAWLELRAEALPPGLHPGQSIQIEVRAYRGSDLLHVKRSGPLRLP